LRRLAQQRRSHTANQQKQAAKSAANAQQNAANQAIQQTEQNYQRTAGNLNPYISAGNNALGTMNALNSGDYSSFTASPDYQFTCARRAARNASVTGSYLKAQRGLTCRYVSK